MFVYNVYAFLFIHFSTKVLSELKADDLPYVPFSDELDAPTTQTELPSGMNKRYCSNFRVIFLCSNLWLPVLYV